VAAHSAELAAKEAADDFQKNNLTRVLRMHLRPASLQ
jgi:hypothetical protein